MHKLGEKPALTQKQPAARAVLGAGALGHVPSTLLGPQVLEGGCRTFSTTEMGCGAFPGPFLIFSAVSSSFHLPPFVMFLPLSSFSSFLLMIYLIKAAPTWPHPLGKESNHQNHKGLFCIGQETKPAALHGVRESRRVRDTHGQVATCAHLSGTSPYKWHRNSFHQEFQDVSV